ncbi:MAG TPA: helix-turn-helix domain-containing protein [Opitutaceae bacterium]|nr:helix-turn-helix domain-containing protein [Opitutaceae bacterium]
MRQLLHPAPEEITVEGVLHALSDPVRAQIFARLAGSGAAQMCSDFREVRERAIPKSTLSQHFKVLREAGLIRSERRGVEMRSTSRCAEIERRFPGLIPAIMRARQAQSSGRGRGPAARRPRA